MKSIKLGWIILGDGALRNEILIGARGLVGGGLNAAGLLVLPKNLVLACVKHKDKVNVRYNLGEQ